MSRMDYCAGLDIGTSSVKALALGTGGELLGVRQQAYPSQTDASGRHEQDPELISGATLTVLRALLDGLPEHRPVAVTFSAAMHGLIAVDRDHRPLTPHITWADTRAAAEASAFKATPEARRLYQITGTPIHPMSPFCKLLWLQKTEPALFDRASQFVSIKEYVWFKLFGRYEVDYSIASATGLFDTQNRRWSADAGYAAGINEYQLSAPVPVTHSRKGAAGFPPDLPFVIGAGDGCLANLGSGVVSPGEAAVTIGTSGAVRVVTPDWRPDPEERLFQYYLYEGAYVRGGATNNGGNLLDWFMQIGGDVPSGTAAAGTTGAAAKHAALQAAFALPGSEGLLFLPYLYGERAPIWDADARGAFVGLRSYHGKPHLLRAITEGIGLALYDSFRILDTEAPIDTVYASGGFTQNPEWVQQLADTFGKTVRLTDDGDASATGAALIGFLTQGALGNLSDARRYIRAGATFTPRPDKYAAYQRSYGLYAKLYPALGEVFHQL